MTKEEFKFKAKQSIDEVSAKINELNAKRASVKADVKSKYEDALEDLKSKRDILEAKYHELKNSTDDKWEEVRDAFSSASNSFKDGLSKISSLFS